MLAYYASALNLVYAAIIASAFYAQGQAFYKPLVQMVGVQSALIAGAAVIAYLETGALDLLFLGAIIFLIRGLLTPYLLLRAIGKKFGERERIAGFALLLIVDLAFFSVTMFILYNFVILRLFPSEFDLVFALSLLLQGLYLMLSRNSTPSQMVGYLEEENALVIFGIALIPIPLLIEVSVLLDVLGLVVISSVVIHERKLHTPLEELKG